MTNKIKVTKEYLENLPKQNVEQVKTDLRDINDICMTLIGIADDVFNMDRLDNRAYNVLLILKQQFADELQKVASGEIIPF